MRVDAQQHERPEQHRENRRDDAVDSSQVVEEVVLRRHHAAHDHVDEAADRYAHTANLVGVRCQSRFHPPAGERVVSDKSPKKDSSGKKEGMTLKEKRSAKKIKQADKAAANKNL